MTKVQSSAVLAILAIAAAVLTACGSSSPNTAASSGSTTTHGSRGTTTTAASSASSGGELTHAQFTALDPCSVLTTSQMEALVGGSLSGTPTSNSGAGPHECQFAATVNGSESPGSIQIAYFASSEGQSAKDWINENESGYHPQSESGLGDYAVFDPNLKETSVAKGPIAIVVSGNPVGATASVETLQAQTAAAIIQKIFS